MKLLMIDNYDSFTYNIVQYFGELGAQVEVFRNDEITVAKIEARLNAGQLDRLVISPGPRMRVAATPYLPQRRRRQSPAHRCVRCSWGASGPMCSTPRW